MVDKMIKYTKKLIINYTKDKIKKEKENLILNKASKKKEFLDKDNKENFNRLKRFSLSSTTDGKNSFDFQMYFLSKVC